MHISDGLLPVAVYAGGYVIGGVATALSLRRVGDRDVPRLALMTSAFFAASLIHLKLGGTSVHLLLHGLVGAVVGPGAMVPIVVGLVMQALLFGHGGVTAIGVNAVMIGMPALLAGWCVRKWGVRRCGGRRCPVAGAKRLGRSSLVGFMAGFGAMILSLLIFLAVGLTAEAAFFTAIRAFLLAHVPLAVVEGLITGAAVGFLVRVKPEVFDDQ
jgi:cobalt/nickel transport system permease protein